MVHLSTNKEEGIAEGPSKKLGSQVLIWWNNTATDFPQFQ